MKITYKLTPMEATLLHAVVRRGKRGADLYGEFAGMFIRTKAWQSLHENGLLQWDDLDFPRKCFPTSAGLLAAKQNPK